MRSGADRGSDRKAVFGLGRGPEIKLRDSVNSNSAEQVTQGFLARNCESYHIIVHKANNVSISAMYGYGEVKVDEGNTWSHDCLVKMWWVRVCSEHLHERCNPEKESVRGLSVCLPIELLWERFLR